MRRKDEVIRTMSTQDKIKIIEYIRSNYSDSIRKYWPAEKVLWLKNLIDAELQELGDFKLHEYPPEFIHWCKSKHWPIDESSFKVFTRSVDKKNKAEYVKPRSPKKEIDLCFELFGCDEVKKRVLLYINGIINDAECQFKIKLKDLAR